MYFSERDSVECQNSMDLEPSAVMIRLGREEVYCEWGVKELHVFRDIFYKCFILQLSF